MTAGEYSTIKLNKLKKKNPSKYEKEGKQKPKPISYKKEKRE